MTKMQKAAYKAWETRRKNESFLKLMQASAALYDELIRFGPTDEDMEGAMDTFVEAFQEARYSWGIQAKVNIGSYRRRSRKK